VSSYVVVCVCTFTHVPQDFLDILDKKVWHDPFRCHDPLVLHWLVSLKFESIITDFAAPGQQTALGGNTTMPPNQKVDYETAKVTWDNFWRGHLDLQGLFKEHGSKVCLVAPERSAITNRLVALLQRYLMAQHLKTDKDTTHTLSSIVHTNCVCHHLVAKCVLH
jgi:hypothetical protein